MVSCLGLEVPRKYESASTVSYQGGVACLAALAALFRCVSAWPGSGPCHELAH